MLLQDMCDREAFSLSAACLAGWRMTTGMTAVPVRGWHTISKKHKSGSPVTFHWSWDQVHKQGYAMMHKHNREHVSANNREAKCVRRLCFICQLRSQPTSLQHNEEWMNSPPPPLTFDLCVEVSILNCFDWLMLRAMNNKTPWHFHTVLPMLIAVSCLSPVRIQILMSAFISVSMVSGTLSWSLSSMAVAPSSCRFYTQNEPETQRKGGKKSQ